MAETIQIPEGEASSVPKRTWCFWSTTETIQNEIVSVTAIVETLVVVPLYWWIALRFGVIHPLMISVVVAPLVLLRSEESIALGVKWWVGFEKNLLDGPELYDMSSAIRHRVWETTVLSGAAAIVLTCLSIWYLSLLMDIRWYMLVPMSIIVIISLVSFFIFFITVSALFLPSGSIIHFIIREYKSDFLVILASLLPGVIVGLTFGLLFSSIGIRMAATLANLRPGIKALPGISDS